jgi:hypothetical protein
VDHPEYGEVIQLQGDQRNDVCEFLSKSGLATSEQVCEIVCVCVCVCVCCVFVCVRARSFVCTRVCTRRLHLRLRVIGVHAFDAPIDAHHLLPVAYFCPNSSRFTVSERDNTMRNVAWPPCARPLRSGRATTACIAVSSRQCLVPRSVDRAHHHQLDRL